MMGDVEHHSKSVAAAGGDPHGDFEFKHKIPICQLGINEYIMILILIVRVVAREQPGCYLEIDR